MKREIVIPIILGFLAKDSPFWLAEEDTVENHVLNFCKGVQDHPDVIKKVIAEKDIYRGKDAHKTDRGSWP